MKGQRAIFGAFALLLAFGTAACGDEDAPQGERLFNANCATCHGEGALGTESGPPLIHPLYVPGHHNDDAIRRAVRNGVPAHHWFFGDMPPVPGVSDDDLEQIIAYLREQQRAGGIF